MQPEEHVVKKLNFVDNQIKVFIAVLVLAVLAGTTTGYILSSGSSKSAVSPQDNSGPVNQAQQDAKTFRDFAEGKISKKPEVKPGEDYTEGTHLLIRSGATPVALTSSVVDLAEYEGKDVKVYGETQKAIKEGWLMDVGRVEAK